MAEELVLQQPPRKFSFFMIVGIIVFLYLFVSVIVEVADGIAYYSKYSDISPIMDSSIGMLVAHDFLMDRAILRLQNPNLDKEYADYLKTKIFQSFIMLFTVVWFVMWLLAKMFRGGAYHLVWFLVAIMLIFILELVYIRTLHKIPVGDYIPFTGFWHFFKFTFTNPAFIANVGNQSLGNTFGNFSV